MIGKRDEERKQDSSRQIDKCLSIAGGPGVSGLEELTKDTEGETKRDKR